MYCSWECIIVMSHEHIAVAANVQDKGVCHFFKRETKKKKKKKGKIHSLALALTLTVTLSPNQSATRHCWQLWCTTLPLMHQPRLQYNNTWRKEPHYMTLTWRTLRNSTWKITLNFCLLTANIDWGHYESLSKDLTPALLSKFVFSVLCICIVEWTRCPSDSSLISSLHSQSPHLAHPSQSNWLNRWCTRQPQAPSLHSPISPLYYCLLVCTLWNTGSRWVCKWYSLWV